MPGWMVVVTAVVVLLPVVLMFGMNRRKLADSQGRRLSRRWRVKI